MHESMKRSRFRAFWNLLENDTAQRRLERQSNFFYRIISHFSFSMIVLCDPSDSETGSFLPRVPRLPQRKRLLSNAYHDVYVLVII